MSEPQYLSLANGFLHVTIMQNPDGRYYASVGEGTHIRYQHGFISEGAAKSWAVATATQTIKLMQRELSTLKSRWVIDFSLLAVTSGIAIALPFLVYLLIPSIWNF